MIRSEKLLWKAVKKFEAHCIDLISKQKLNLKLKRVVYTLIDGTDLYIQYNNYSQYSYQIVFSPKKQDLSRFDNFDDHWDVSTKPHHYHARFEYIPKSSPMTGNPDNDMEKLCDFLRTHI